MTMDRATPFGPLPADLCRRIDAALRERHPMLVAHVNAQGQPVLSFRGSVHVHARDELALWIRQPQGGFMQAIARHPQVALMYRDEDARATYQFQGRAQVVDDPTTRQAIFARIPPAEQAHDPQQRGAAVRIVLDRVEGYAGLGPQGRIDPLCLVRQATPSH